MVAYAEEIPLSIFEEKGFLYLFVFPRVPCIAAICYTQ